MKSERRHELQHNDLAEWFITTYERWMPYRNAIIGVALLVIVAGVAWTIWRSRSEGAAADAWYTIGSPLLQLDMNRLEKVATDDKGSPAGEWALLLTADMYLQAAENQLLEHKDVASQYLSTAMDRYEKTLQASSNPLARERSLFGKARIFETANKLPEAKAAYEELNKEFPKGAYKAIADNRLAQLDRPEVKEFYKALSEYNPKAKAAKAAEKSAAGPRGKLENMTLPDNPDEQGGPKPPIKPPASGSGKPPASGSGTTPSAPKATSTPATPLPPKIEAPKSTAAKPLATAAPAASSSAPAKK